VQTCPMCVPRPFKRRCRAKEQRNHNPRVGGSSPSSGITPVSLGAAELCTELRERGSMQLRTIACDDPHPLLGGAEGGVVDQLRVVHDVFGHAALGVGFDLQAEYATWLQCGALFSPAARPAAFCELVGAVTASRRERSRRFAPTSRRRSFSPRVAESAQVRECDDAIDLEGLALSVEQHEPGTQIGECRPDERDALRLRDARRGLPYRRWIGLLSSHNRPLMRASTR
jgi:hypothetical protein